MSTGAAVDARLFDGRTSRAVPVRLSAQGAEVELAYADGSQAPERIDATVLKWHEPLGAMRRVDLPGGRVCEVQRGPALKAFLAACDHRERAITVWQGSGLRVFIAVMVLMMVGFAGYRWGLPLVSKGIAAVVPEPAVTALDEHFLASLDHTDLLKPTQLDRVAQAEIRVAVEPLLAAQTQRTPLKLLFRAAPRIGPNAFALPGGTVVVTDELVELAQSPAQVAAVVAHELGHVRHRHGLRNMIQASILAAVVTVWTGDASALATAGASVLLNSAYSRDFEREADDYGAQLLLRTGQSPMLLADMLDRLTRKAAAEGADETDAAPEDEERGWTDYMASHPPTPERIARLKQAAEAATR